jgi:hypothetical protein
MNSPQTFELPATKATYTYTCGFRVSGLSSLPANKAVEMASGEAGTRIRLVTQDDDALAYLDRSAAQKSLVMRRFFTGAELTPLQAEIDRIRQQRENRFGAGVYLIVEASAEVTTQAALAITLSDGTLVSTDIVDKAAIAASHKNLVSRAVTAVGLLNSQSPDLQFVGQETTLLTSDGRTIAPLNIGGGSAYLTLARPFTEADQAAVSKSIAAMAAQPYLKTPSRLLADALAQRPDTLEAFVFAWGTLETLINPFASSLRCEDGVWIDDVTEAHRNAARELHEAWRAGGHKGYSLADKICAFSLTHGFGTSTAIIKEFRRINNAYREPLSHHGDIPGHGASEELIRLVRELMQMAVNNKGPPHEQVAT